MSKEVASPSIDRHFVSLLHVCQQTKLVTIGVVMFALYPLISIILPKLRWKSIASLVYAPSHPKTP